MVAGWAMFFAAGRPQENVHPIAGRLDSASRRQEEAYHYLHEYRRRLKEEKAPFGGYSELSVWLQ